MSADRFYAQNMGGGAFAYVIDREVPALNANVVAQLDCKSARALATLLNAALTAVLPCRRCQHAKHEAACDFFDGVNVCRCEVPV